MNDWPPLHDYGRSVAVLMGSWDYSFLGRVPAAEHSLRRMEGLLAGPLCGWPRDRMLVLPNVPSPGDLPDRLITAFDAATDVALFYFVGHGQLAPDDQLCLGLLQSRPEPNRRAATSLRFGDVRQALQDSSAAVKLVILDCCFAGLATKATLAAGLADDVLDLTAGTGAYTMAATSAYATAWYQDERGLARPQTYFTKYLADLVESGIPGQPARLRVDSLFRQLRDNLAAGGRPVPHSRAVNNAREFIFAYNAAPSATHRDPEQELARLGRRLAETENLRAAADARISVLQAEVAGREWELARLKEQLASSGPRDAQQQRELQDAIEQAARLLDSTRASQAALTAAQQPPLAAARGDAHSGDQPPVLVVEAAGRPRPARATHARHFRGPHRLWLAAFAAAVALLGALVIVKPAWLTIGAPATATGQQASTGASVVAPATISACPPEIDDSQDRIALFAASAGSGSGSVTLSPLAQAGTHGATARKGSAMSPGALSLLSASAGGVSGQQSWSVAETGTMAQGVPAEVADSSGLAYASCGEPGSSIWFAGPGPRSGAGQIRLDLMNVDDVAAMVSVTIITEAGPGAGYSKITVAPHELVSKSLSSVASGSNVVAIEVRTSAGRVAAAVSESTGHGTASWVPATAAPSTNLIIPGVPPTSTGLDLFLVVPGATEARIDVTALTGQGSYQPLGSQTVNLPGESATYLPLAQLSGAAVALRITSNVPVSASALVPGTGIGTFATAAQPIAQQAVIAGNTTAGGLAALVTLTAPATGTRVRVTETASAAATAGQIITVPAGRTVEVPVTTPPGVKQGTPFAVVITQLSRSSPVYAARIETRRQGIVVSILPASNDEPI
jgi:hypothetical protein